jgi:hypothetical protein
LVAKIKKIKKYFAECQKKALGKESSLPSVCLRPSAKVNGRHLWTAADDSLPSVVFAEGSALGKVVFAECYYVPSVLHSVNEIVTECGTLPSAALVPDKKHSAKGLTLGKGPDSGSGVCFIHIPYKIST